MQIRDFTHTDQETFCRLAQEFYSGGAVLHHVDPANFAATFAQCLCQSPLVRGLLLEHEGQLAGYALLGFTHSNEAGGLVVLLEELYILPALRGAGLGQQFFAWVENEYPEAARLRLEVAPENEGAIRLYERLGFRPLGYLQMIKRQ